jgi:hypothetical protein
MSFGKKWKKNSLMCFSIRDSELKSSSIFVVGLAYYQGKKDIVLKIHYRV